MRRLFFTRLYVASTCALSELIETAERVLETPIDRNTIMTALHSHGANVVASCDWEDDLRGQGKLGTVFED